MTSKADAAFRQATRKVIQIARQTGTPIIVWEEGRVKKIPPDQVEAIRLAMEGKRRKKVFLLPEDVEPPRSVRKVVALFVAAGV